VSKYRGGFVHRLADRDDPVGVDCEQHFRAIGSCECDRVAEFRRSRPIWPLHGAFSAPPISLIWMTIAASFFEKTLARFANRCRAGISKVSVLLTAFSDLQDLVQIRECPIHQGRTEGEVDGVAGHGDVMRFLSAQALTWSFSETALTIIAKKEAGSRTFSSAMGW